MSFRAERGMTPTLFYPAFLNHSDIIYRFRTEPQRLPTSPGQKIFCPYISYSFLFSSFNIHHFTFSFAFLFSSFNIHHSTFNISLPSFPHSSLLIHFPAFSSAIIKRSTGLPPMMCCCKTSSASASVSRRYQMPSG
jgi:hypothetical protein